MADWDYGGAWRRHDMSGPIDLPHGSIVQVADLTEAMPDFMRRADTLFIDPPWNTGNLRSFYTKADKEHKPFDFLGFTDHLWGRIGEIAPHNLFIEMGKQHLAAYLTRAAASFRHVTFYNSTYYDRPDHKCYVIHATQAKRLKRYAHLEDMDEARIIAWLCANHDYQCIGDLCMGRGLVGRHAYLAGRRFVGTELNHKRLAVLVDFIRSAETARQPEMAL